MPQGCGTIYLFPFRAKELFLLTFIQECLGNLPFSSVVCKVFDWVFYGLKILLLFIFVYIH